MSYKRIAKSDTLFGITLFNYLDTGVQNLLFFLVKIKNKVFRGLFYCVF